MLFIPFDQIPAAGHPIGLFPLGPIPAPGDRGFTFGISKTTGIRDPVKIPGFWTSPYEGVITTVYLSVDQGGYTVKFTRSRDGSIPTIDDSMNKKGFTIAPPNTHITITNMSDFISTKVYKGDLFSVEITTLTDPFPTDIGGSVMMLKLSGEPLEGFEKIPVL